MAVEGDFFKKSDTRNFIHVAHPGKMFKMALSLISSIISVKGPG